MDRTMEPSHHRATRVGIAVVAVALNKLTGAERAEAGHDTVTAPTNTNVVHLGVINDGGNAANNEFRSAYQGK